ncbi:uncharacterized protein F5891DRAFT_1198476 [Suillus fuscotomentosus]|uniref:Uncharacterized protein n=1 Tax=Suillus fuscotomentosus TaxID=1912939 RepID=A0AAD4HBZ5_9AGAM|nr:uncharacterized protein F5891DRAFT_1198476 [Suillus fuscotomentosus]KAG1889705.1 hypothetical protein F5891DRAFT_1198476 [Suillus fuscotomentosus]
MDGEAPEWGWANINRVVASTKEMAPGTRQDILDDRFGDWNWKKVTALDLEGSIKESDSGVASLAAWMKEIVAWEKDHTKPNPFNSQSREVTQAAVRLALVQQDTKDLEEGISISLHSEVTPSILISMGLDLEDVHVEVSQSDENTGDAASGCPKVKPDSIKPEDILLLLPSDICNLTMCDTKLLEVEWSLRLAQANDALN